MMPYNGLLYINEQDAWLEYGAYLAEEKKGDHNNYDSLMKPAKAKTYTPVDFREEDGEKYPDVLVSRSEGRDIDLRFALLAGNKTMFLANYKKFLQELKSGWLNLRFPELGITFRVFYKDSSGYEQLTYFEENEVGAILKVKFREPVSSF